MKRTKKTNSVKRYVRRVRKTYRNKLVAIALVTAGIVSSMIGNDGTFLLFSLMLGLPLFFAKEDWIY